VLVKVTKVIRVLRTTL